MTYSTIQYTVDDGIATITLNRPDRLNAYNRQMHEEIIAAMDVVDADDDVRAVVFTGAGRAYCAGADLERGEDTFKKTGSPDTFDMAHHADGGGQLTLRLFESTKPLIAAINGPAVGVGVTSTLPMDFRIASETAKFGFVFARRGIVPEAASSWFLPRLVGISQALDWVYSGRIFSAHEALDAGLVRSVHTPDDLLPAAYAFAHELTDNSSAVSIAVARRMLWQMLDVGTAYMAHEIDSRGIFHLGRAADCAEGVSSFLAKRPAEFPMKVSTDLPDYVKKWREIGSADKFLDADR